ncbi:MAG: (d)CMP kinase [Marinilabiliaceae bacterium]|nr:(d)CMP kinase [Bacteroidales bacterium]MDD5815156.1 (d)CMP kinase [Bacteroidales bacterium]MDY4520557.1 (d)CMP kinase [Bacteroidales bacterium]
MKPTRNIIIAVDGHSSCGKSTVAKQVARAIGIAYIDTGAMYRAVTLFALRHGLMDGNQPNALAIEQHLNEVHISFDFDQQAGRNTTFLNDENVEDQIRNMEVSSHVSAVSAIPAVRAKLTEWQRQMAQSKSVIMDGRDIGTAVFPNADLKIFMTARPEVRAQRRYDELKDKGQDANLQDILQNVVDRDRQDSTRSVSPLRQADDAVVLDNSDITREEQYDFILNLLAQRGLIA